MVSTTNDPHLLPHTIVVARGDLLATDLSETEAVMLDIDKGAYYGVESVAKTIWDAIAEPKSVQAVCRLVAEQYDAEPAEIETDTIEFLGQLIRAGLITVEAGS